MTKWQMTRGLAKGASANPGRSMRRMGVRLTRIVLQAGIYLALALVAIAILLPYAYVISGSLRTEMNQFRAPIQWIPPAPQWQNYLKPFTQYNFARYFANSGLLAGVTMASSLLFCTLAGYSIAKIKFPGSNIIFLLILSTMMIPDQVTMIPMYIIFKGLRLVNTYLGMILPSLAGAFGVFLIRQFCTTIPEDYLDAARIDGANEPRIFVSIVLPMLRAPLSALGIFAFTGSWNNFMWPLIIVESKALYTVPLAVVSYLGEQVKQEYGQVQALTVIASVPVFVIFLLLQKEFVRGASISGLKG